MVRGTKRSTPFENREGARRMNNSGCGGCGKFVLGVATGMAAGAALGMTMAPSHRQIKRVNEAVENLAEAMDL